MARHTNYATCISTPAQQGYLLLRLLGRLLHEKPGQINFDSPFQLHITVTQDNHIALKWIINMGKSQLEPAVNWAHTSSLARVRPNTERQMDEETYGSPSCVSPVTEPYRSSDFSTRPDFCRCGGRTC